MANQIDMLHGPLIRRILLFALPLAATSTLQQLFSSADVAIIGRFAGSVPLAAVGSNAPIINLTINMFIGLSIGANVVIANYIGQGRNDRVADAVHTTVLLAIIGGIFVGILGICIARPMLILVDSPDNVIDLATAYLRIFFCGMPFMMVYNYGSAILRSKGDTRRPLLILLGSGVIKVGLSLTFVVLLGLSVRGVALATVIANMLNSGAIIYLLLHEEGAFKLYPKRLRISKENLLRILKIGVPAGVQGMVFSFSNVCIQAAVNSFGSDCIAGTSASLNFDYFCYFLLSAFSQTAVTFTSQNYGAQNVDRMKRIWKDCMLLGMGSMFVANITFVLLRSYVVLAFTTDPNVISWALTRMVIVLSFQWIACSYEISGQCLRGMGHSLLPALFSILGSCVLRIVWLFTVFVWYGSYESLMIVYPVTWTVTGIATLIAYFIIRKKEFVRILR